MQIESRDRCILLTSEPELLQNVFKGDDEYSGWRVLVTTILLQRTGGEQVRPVAEKFFSKWNTPDALSAASSSSITSVIAPLGLAQHRTEVLRQLSENYVDWIWNEYVPDPGDRADVAECPSVDRIENWFGIGKYTIQAYKICALGDLSERPEDKRLLVYWEWHAKKTTTSPE